MARMEAFTALIDVCQKEETAEHLRQQYISLPSIMAVDPRPFCRPLLEKRSESTALYITERCILKSHIAALTLKKY